jgi:hypothetical protein
VRTGLAGRLTPVEHANIVGDVLGVQLSALELAATGGGIPQEQPSTGLFRNGADGQAAADDYPLAFGRLAALVAEQVDLAALAAVLPPEGGWLEGVGTRLFRRPLSARELEAFGALHASVLAEGATSEQAERSVLEAMLQSPPFVFRLERELAGPAGEVRALDGFELASRLSFFLWSSAPDAELLAGAQAGTLDGSRQALPALRDEVRRMLADPRAHRLTRELVRDFAGTERAAFIGVTPELRASMLESMTASVDAHLWQDGGRIKDLFTLTHMTFDPNVAALVGLTPSGSGLARYDVSALPERVGWLTHPGFIAGLGDASVGKIVQRGVTLMVKLMCRQPAQLPEGLAATIADFNVEFAGSSERERSEQRQSLATCWACHSQFEPLAYGFDRLDAAGRFRGEVDAEGRALPNDGWLTDDLGVDESERARYASAAELMTLLADSEVVQACMAEHFLAYATGRASSAVEHAFSLPVHAAQERAGGTLDAMVESVATSHLFRSLASSGAAP